jgi:general secretion pathway protein G
MRGLASRVRRAHSGFTLLEIIIVITIITILVAIAVPIYTQHLRHSREVVLKEDLYTMRNCIDQYTQDKQKAPQALSDLVEAGYIKAIPKDPFTNSTESWEIVQEDVLMALDQTQPGITDVHSGSNQMSTEGTAYSTW